MGIPATNSLKWYYKVEDKMAGPVPGDDLIRLLVEGRIFVTVEISNKSGRWRCLCDDPDFEAFVKAKLDRKNLIQTAENSHPSGKKSVGIDFDVKSMATSIEGQLLEAQTLSKANFEASAIRNIITQMNLHRQNGPVVVPDKVTQKAGRSIEYDMTAYRKSQGFKLNWKKLLNRVFIVLVIAGLGLGAYKLFGVQRDRLSQEAMKAQQELIKLALQAKSMGDYKKSLEDFRKIDPPPTMDSALWYEFAEAALREGRMEETQKYAEQAAKHAKTPVERARARVISGINAFGKDDHDGAAKFYQQALDDMPQSIPALYNLALVHIHNKKLDDAERLLRGAIQSGIAEPPVLLAFSEVALALDSDVKQVKRVLEAEGHLAEYTKRRDDYRYEIVLAELRMAVYRKDGQRIDEKLAQFLEVNPDIHTRQSRTFELSHSRIEGRPLYNWCLEVYSLLPKNPSLNGMIALCLFRNGDVNEAVKFATAASQAAPRDPRLSGLLGYLLVFTGQGEKAFAQFEKTSKFGASKAEMITRATLCEKQGNWSCAIENWKKVKAADPTEIAAVEGLVKIYANEKRVEDARELLKVGMDRYPNLIPLQKVSRDIQ